MAKKQNLIVDHTPRRRSSSLYRVQFSGALYGHVDVWAETPAHARIVAAAHQLHLGGRRGQWFATVSQIAKAHANPVNSYQAAAPTI